jgi:hypothetical protein
MLSFGLIALTACRANGPEPASTPAASATATATDSRGGTDSAAPSASTDAGQAPSIGEAKILEHLGGLQPGESKPVPPFP